MLRQLPNFANRSRLPGSRLGTITGVGTIKPCVGADINRSRSESFPGASRERFILKIPFQINDLLIVPGFPVIALYREG
ncbi:hypothetical protein [Oryzisolibacter sp. LB2S]|uniref:hypothetical protein n=1 Tax=Alicycliphilus soli TaxID=3228789 RepID=UPI003459B829